jgi:YD repeat-containing protein
MSADGTVWLYRDESDQALEVYRQDGSLATIAYADGRRLSFVGAWTSPASPLGSGKYLVQSIVDEAGRSISFDYLATGDYRQAAIGHVTDPAGVVLPMGYDAAGNLTTITYADQTVHQFIFDDVLHPHLMTRRIDESGVAVGTYSYDPQGRVVSSRTGSLQPWTVRWMEAPLIEPQMYYDQERDVVIRKVVDVRPVTAIVTDPSGRASTWTGTSAGRAALVGGRSQPAGAGCSASTSAAVFDAAANVTQSDDFNGNRSCMTYDSTRNLEMTRVEGVSSATACESVGTASLPTGARMISTQWHPDWRMAVRTAEPRRITTLVYNGQPDPFNGGTVANCAPATALLPDGKPIVVLCKRAEQVTTDETGGQGFGATPQPGVPVRATSWTYDATGLVLTETDSAGRVVVSNVYYADTTAEHTKGDLQSTANAANHLTQFPRYNAYGQPLEMIDANGISTTYAYDPRQRLVSVATQGKVSSYEYWPTGLLKKTTQSDGNAVSYEYDDAHRLIAASDSQGNRVEYTLDASGNRTQEVAKDPSGTLKRTMSRVFDALGRAQQTTGRE